MTNGERAALKAELRRALGEALRELRARRGQPTQETLAERVSMDRSYWAALERGERSIGLFGLWQLAEALGVSLSRLSMVIDQHFRRLRGLSVMPPRTPVEKALRRLRDFMDQSPEMKWLGSPYAKTVHCNQPMLRYLGLSLADLEGKSAWQEVIHPEDRAEYVAKNKRSYSRREPRLSRYRMRGKDGEYKIFVEHAVPQFTKKIFIGFLGTMIEEPPENNG